ncbi:hypothetical protein Enr17x_10440 [Gimesia fumaroli]|uniref:Uncharacterized protein n=1 Tax=Gimesia fumaroli TaxID=2527976 RepID=A0A518I7K6_9PLAN|nr:hypothetical protein Enr17x_10440 [Gimesia fumaroli]
MIQSHFWKLPPRFEFYTDGCRCDRLIEAYGFCERGVWCRTEIVTHLNYRPGYTTSEREAHRFRKELLRWERESPDEL